MNPRSPSRGVAAEEGAYIIATAPDDKHVPPAPHQRSNSPLLFSLTFNIHDFYHHLVDNLIVSRYVLFKCLILCCSSCGILILSLKLVVH